MLRTFSENPLRYALKLTSIPSGSLKSFQNQIYLYYKKNILILYIKKHPSLEDFQPAHSSLIPLPLYQLKYNQNAL